MPRHSRPMACPGIWPLAGPLVAAITWLGAIGGMPGAWAQVSEIEEELADEPQILRVATDFDYPPFNYLDEEGVLTGFNVDVARALCLELDVTCDIVARDWDQLVPALDDESVDMVIASIARTAETVGQVDFSDPYYFTPGRFVARRDAPQRTMTARGLEGERLAVVAGTSHEAFLRQFFLDSIVITYPNHDAARTAVMDGTVPYLFGDGIALTFWLNGTSSKACCELRGQPFADATYFGSGIGIAVRRENRALRNDINRALRTLRQTGRFEELFLRYFPLSIYE